MKKKLLFPLFFLLYVLLWAESNTLEYYNLKNIQASFPTSTVERKASKYEVVAIENHFQGYTIFLHHYPEENLSQKIYYDTLQEAAKQNLLNFFSKTGYTTLIDVEHGFIYGIFSEKKDFVSVRFTNIDSIPHVLSTLDKKYSNWKNF